MNSYEVGHVIYLLQQKTLNILPAIIVEEIVRKTLEGKTTQYVVKFPDDKKILLSDISEKIFHDIDTLRSFMLENTRQSVEKLIQNAVSIKESAFSIHASVDLDISEDNNTVQHHEQHVQNDIKDVIMNSNINNTVEV